MLTFTKKGKWLYYYGTDGNGKTPYYYGTEGVIYYMGWKLKGFTPQFNNLDKREIMKGIFLPIIKGFILHINNSR